MSNDEKNRQKRKSINSDNSENKPKKRLRTSNLDSPIIVSYNYSDDDKTEQEE